ncbi:MAG TPA: isocitrate/isopropylmalate family dehydrogenase, partial [Methanomicrobiales archaeon]|nr:isocitrate/isopropylmalate family dehydrogenase [Methanomicrobiales archaeon]
RHALFEPVHGSAPKHAGKDTANPVAAVRSAAMLLEYLGDRENAAKVDQAVGRVLASGVRTRDLGGTAGTKEMGKAILAALGKRG